MDAWNILRLNGEDCAFTRHHSLITIKIYGLENIFCQKLYTRNILPLSFSLHVGEIVQEHRNISLFLVTCIVKAKGQVEKWN